MIHKNVSISTPDKRTISHITKGFRGEGLNIAYELLQSVSNKSKEFLYANPEHILTPTQYSALLNYIQRIKEEEPLAYILGYKYFYASKFTVSKDTLIPRPETELLVERVLKSISSQKLPMLRVLEIGTGSGAISISILKGVIKEQQKYPQIKVLATDISKKALEIAQRNAAEIIPSRAKKSIRFEHADILPKTNNESFDIIVSNPPYITSDEYQKLTKSVKEYEPRVALEGGEKGLDIYIKILEKTKNNTKPTTRFLFEINPIIRKDLERLIKEYYPSSRVNTWKDQYKEYRFIEFIVR